jgi:hypothetical protein
MNRRYWFAAAALSLFVASAARAHAPSGAIFTTVKDGSEVNFNHYAAKEDVYLDGGPGPGAPQTAAGLDDGTYVFQVTDPSGKKLLSTDPPKNRRFTVANGIITALVPSGDATLTPHNTGLDVDHGALTVQLMPYLDTPNNGGVYKAWVTFEEDYKAGARALGVPAGQELEVVDAGYQGGNCHGFVPAHSKTDNFKVKAKAIVEIDTRFRDNATGQIIDGLGVTWYDTLGASNKKYSYYAPQLQVYHEAHVEATEVGTHMILVDNGPGHTVTKIRCPDGTVIDGPGVVKVNIRNDNRDLTIFIDVYVDLAP